MPRLNRDLTWLAGALLLWGMGEGMFYSFQPLYLEELGANSLEIGVALSLVGTIMMVSHLPAGYLADRLGRRVIVVSAWIIGCLATGIMALAPNLTLFVAGSALYGFTNFVMAPLNSYITAARGTIPVGRAITTLSATFSLGGIAGPLLGGWIASQSGLRASFGAAALAFVISTFLVFQIRHQPVEARGADQPSPLRALLLNQRFLIFLGIVFIVCLATYLPQPLSSNYLVNQAGISYESFGLLVSVLSMGVVLANLTIGRLNARLGFMVCQVALAGFALLLWQGQAYWQFAIGYALAGSYRTMRALAIALSRSLVQPANMGLAYGVIETFASLALILGPLLAGWLYDQDPASIYSVGLVGIGAAFFAAWIFLPVKASEVI